MTGNELLDLMHESHRRVNVTGTPDNGIIAALDLEGRIFTVVNNRILNRVVPAAILNRTNKTAYLNPGGDTLWPAPEGTCFGYEYTTGKWRVPPSVTGASWEVTESVANKMAIRAEIDLVNNRQLGIPCEFERHIEIMQNRKSQIQHVTEIIRYIGNRPLNNSEFRLAPWSLCQFDSGEGSKVILPSPPAGEIWDLYEPSLSKHSKSDSKYVIDTNTDFRFQLGLGKTIPWIEFMSNDDFQVRRYNGALPQGQSHIDISDVSPDQFPSDKGVSLSIYCDPSGFMEIEACGGCPDTLYPGTELSVKITTEYVVY